MASTRFYYDPCRTKKRVQQSTDTGRWVLDVPGNGGANPDFFLDPQLIPQKWGANLHTNTTNLESDLRGVNRRLSGRDCVGNVYQAYNVPNQLIPSATNSTMITDQSRTTNPAWWYRDAEQNNFDYLFLNPQTNVCIPFENSLSTRILEKDYFTPKRDCVTQETKTNLPSSYDLIRGTYVGGPITCAQTNACENL